MSVAEHSAPPVDLAPRIASIDPADFPVPTGREEEWRFAPIDGIRDFFAAAPGTGAVAADSDSSLVANLQTSDRRIDWIPTSLTAAVARSQAATTVAVDIPADADLAEPVVARLVASAPRAAQHIEVRAGRFSRSTVVLELDPAADIAGAIVVDVADGAELTLVVIVDGDRDHRLVADLPIRLGRDSRFIAASVVCAGRIVRLKPSVHYRAPGGSAELLGVFFVEGQQVVEQRVFVEHEQPHCTSRVVYKGALSGKGAHSIWVGDVLVRREAVGTDTYELNRNLIIDDGARADSVPNLELETGDVAGAGHASATGRFDDEQLFYLMARGIPEILARQLVVRGFFADVVSRIPSEYWRDDIMRRIELRLGMDAGDE